MSGQVGVLSRHPTQMSRHRRTGGTCVIQEATDVEREEPHASALVFDQGKRTVRARAEITSAYSRSTVPQIWFARSNETAGVA